MDGEQWRPVVGHEEYYEVSNRGRVRSLGRMVNRGRAGWRWMDGRILKRNRSNNRYMVALSVNGAERRCQVSVLVLEAFAGPCPPGMECCHWDDNPNNDHIDNLRWALPAENMADRLRNGRNHHAVKTKCPRGHDLFPPNIFKRIDGRECRACNNTGSWARRRGVPRDDPRWQAEADTRYREIMAGTGRYSGDIQAECYRGHRLVAPNLVPSITDRRACLTCDQMRKWGARKAIPPDDPRWKAEADRRYAEIMAAA